MSKLHVCIDETWLFKVVEGNVFDRFLSNPHYFRLLYPHCALKTRRKNPTSSSLKKPTDKNPSYYKRVVFIDRSPAECYNSFRVLWIGEKSLP